MSRFVRGAGLVIIAVALAGCGSSHPAGPPGRPGQPRRRAAEGYLSFGLGLAARVPYHVSTLTGPDRVVIDVSHAASR
jgi:hypothetical protein